MFFVETEAHEYGVKPMNCPGHCFIYADTNRSYRELPLRLAEAGIVHRNEASGVLHGLLRVRHITQDDAHIFCALDQVEDEVIGCLDYGFFLYDLLGFDIHVELSTRPEKRLGAEADWDLAEAALANALRRQGVEYQVNEGDGAFYGPKIDLHMKDSLGRSWQIGTIQLDFQMPQRFGLVYAGSDNREHHPVMIHKALLGAFERFIGILLEHTGGELPVWLAPLQVRVVPVAEDHRLAAADLASALAARDVRADVDMSEETMGKRIRNAELEKIPYVAVLGDKELEAGTVALRVRGAEQGVVTVQRDAALDEIQRAATL
jgi:threonyl-tRNA synthetase